MRLCRIQLYTILGLMIFFTQLQVSAWDVKCEILSGPTFVGNEITETGLDKTSQDKRKMPGSSLSFSKEPGGNFKIDLPLLNAAPTRLESSNFDSLAAGCSPFFKTDLNDGLFHFTLEFTLNRENAARIFDHKSGDPYTFDAIIRANGRWKVVTAEYQLDEKVVSGKATLSCEDNTLSPSTTLDDVKAFVEDLQKKCTKFSAAYKDLNSKNNTVLAFNQQGTSRPTLRTSNGK